MSRPPLEVADVFRAHARDFLEACGGVVSSAKKKVLRALVACRTAVLGGHRYVCSDECGYERFAYKPCGNRHCPKCQAAARAEWLEARARDLLAVEYFHVVFTLPVPLAEIALQNKKVMYDLLFRASADTLRTIAADPKHLGAQIGFIGLLHTWGQTLLHHPHVHYVVPGGGLGSDGSKWVSCPPGFFLPVRALGRLFRGKFLDLTRRAFTDGQLSFQGRLAPLADPATFAAHLAPTYEIEWNVYAKPPFGGPAQVLKYLARYTHRVAISNHRLVSLHDGEVRFRWKDYAHQSRPRIMTLSAAEFIRRFLLHVLPKGFVHIRHFGFLTNSVRAKKLPRCRELLGASDAHTPSVADIIPADACEGAADAPGSPCPKCGKGHIVRHILDPVPGVDPWSAPREIDSS
ncbi:MAG: IS91 family transposase [Planctomycetota bacterium]